MRIERTSLDGVVILVPELHRDERGYLYESYSKRAFADAGLTDSFVQDNVSWSRAGVLRGLHYQLPRAQAKLVRVEVGRIFDVAVDIRRSSPTFARWEGIWLTAEGPEMLLIAEGFAHGFWALEDSRVHYRLSRPYHPEDSLGIAWDDPDIGIRWPAGVPILSQADRAHPRLAEAVLPD